MIPPWLASSFESGNKVYVFLERDEYGDDGSVFGKLSIYKDGSELATDNQVYTWALPNFGRECDDSPSTPLARAR